MSKFKAYSLPTDADRAARAGDVDRRRYMWFQGYLPPIPTLYNATLGDGARGLGEEVVEEEEERHIADFLLSPEQLDALMDIAVATGPEASADEAIAAHPLFAEPEADTRGLLSSDGYDKQTGVPTPDVPSLLGYGVPRALFNRSNDGVAEDLMKKNPPLRTPADYSQIYNAFLKDSRSLLLKSRKVIGFDNLDQIYDQDPIFGWQRLAGTNPRVLALLSDETLAKIPLTDAMIAAVAGPGGTIAGERAARRLYACDYALLQDIPLQEGRYMTPAIGVFWSDAGASQLLPIAIQLGQTPGRVYTPAGPDWALAKLQFSVSDFNYHEMGTHLCEAHFAQEAFAVATRRNLPPQHPIGALLLQIYWALLYNNALGRLSLVNPGGFTDQMMAGQLANGSLQIVKSYYSRVWTWDDWNLDLYVAKKGTGDTTALPVYPYRDDGLPLWRAIQAFAAAYVDAYYPDAPEVAGDTELQSWLSELIDPAKGNLASKGFPTELNTKAALSEVLARLIWQAGPGHGGINYSQFQHFAVVPNQPGAAYADQGPVMGALPNLSKAIAQVSILNIITQDVFGSIGDYDSDFTSKLSDTAKNAVRDFQSALAAVGRQVDQRNSTGPRAALKYPFLHPKNLPNSTNI